MSIEEEILFQRYNIRGYDVEKPDFNEKVMKLDPILPEKIIELQETC